MKKQLPKNWVEVSLKEVTNNRKGKKPNVQSEVDFDGSISYMDIKALEHNIIRQYADIESSKLFEEGDIAMVWDGARSGWVSKTNMGAIGSTLVAFQPILFNSNYLYYYLLEKYPFINSNARGVGIPHVDPTVLWSLDFPLPPLPEQNRIVEKLDSFFSQLETIKASMANIPLLLKDFRQQILTKAVTGKLTEEWRKGKKIEKVKSISLKEILIKVKNSIPERKFFKGTFNYFDIGSINNLNNTITESKEILVKDAPSRARQELLENDILLSTVRTYLKNTAIIDFPINEKNYASTGFYIIRVNTSKALPRFIFYYVISDLFVNKLSEFQRGANYPAVRNGDVEKQEIILPSIEEQKEIVNRIRNLFSKADAVEKQYKTIKDKIDNLPQALLNKAFKGDLSEQLDTDGDAKDLLKAITDLKNIKVAKPKAYKVPKEKLRLVAEPK